MALKVTQQGKYLVWALTALGLAVAVVVIERLWVTDNERIESVVYELRRAVLAANPEEVLAQLTPDVGYVQDGISLSGEATRGLIRDNLANAAFDNGFRSRCGNHRPSGWFLRSSYSRITSLCSFSS